jgi:PTS hybrid protein
MSPVGIVLVSHSHDLATGLRTLTDQLAAGLVPVAAAGGTGEGGLGTSYELIESAVAEVDRGAGVLVVMVDAPFVEGAVAACVTASTGAPLAAVAAAAREARGIAKF